MGRLLASPKWGARPETLGRAALSLGPDTLAAIDQADKKRMHFIQKLNCLCYLIQLFPEIEESFTTLYICHQVITKFLNIKQSIIFNRILTNY